MGVEVATVVTEAPLSYSGVKVKIDTITTLEKRVPGPEEMAKLLAWWIQRNMVLKCSLSDEQIWLTGSDGIIVARTIVDICNGELRS